MVIGVSMLFSVLQLDSAVVVFSAFSVYKNNFQVSLSLEYIKLEE